MADLTEKYLDKELVDSMPEKLPPDYDEWLDAQQPDEQQKEYMDKWIDGMSAEQDERELEMEWAPEID